MAAFTFPDASDVASTPKPFALSKYSFSFTQTSLRLIPVPRIIGIHAKNVMPNPLYDQTTWGESSRGNLLFEVFPVFESTHRRGLCPNSSELPACPDRYILEAGYVDRLLDDHSHKGRSWLVDKVRQLGVHADKNLPVLFLSGTCSDEPCPAHKRYGLRTAQVLRRLGAVIDKDGH